MNIRIFRYLKSCNTYCSHFASSQYSGNLQCRRQHPCVDRFRARRLLSCVGMLQHGISILYIIIPSYPIHYFCQRKRTACQDICQNQHNHFHRRASFHELGSAAWRFSSNRHVTDACHYRCRSKTTYILFRHLLYGAWQNCSSREVTQVLFVRELPCPLYCKIPFAVIMSTNLYMETACNNFPVMSEGHHVKTIITEFTTNHFVCAHTSLTFLCIVS